jgi:Leucine-rich repeat (LRR) protein
MACTRDAYKTPFLFLFFRLLYQVGVQEEPTWPGKLAVSTYVFLITICSSLLLLLTFQWHEHKTHPRGALDRLTSSVRAPVASLRSSFESGRSVASRRFRIKPESSSSQQLGQSSIKICFLHYIEPFLSHGKHFVFRKALSLILEVVSQLYLAIQYGRIGVSASIIVFQIFVAVTGLNTLWLLTSKLPFKRQILFVVAEVVVSILYMIVSVVPLADNSRKFVYADGGQCNSLVRAGFGAFEDVCYDMSLRQQITFSLKTLTSNSFVEYWTNTAPLISLILALDHLVRQMATSYGDHSNIYADRDARQLLLPKRVAMAISAVSTILFAYSVGVVVKSEMNCENIDNCMQVAHPLLEPSSQCACTVFVSPQCNNATESDLTSSAERGYLHTVLVGSSTSFNSVNDCSMVNDFPWHLLSRLEVVMLIGTHVIAPATIDSEVLLAVNVRADSVDFLWNKLPSFPSSIVYLALSSSDDGLSTISNEAFEPGNVAYLKNLKLLEIEKYGINTLDISTCDSLEYLELSRNNIKILPDLSHLKHLRILFLFSNVMETLPPLPSSLEVIYVHENNLVDISAIRNLPHLVIARFENNQITKKPYSMYGPPAQLALSMWDNPICDACGPTDCGICEVQCSPGCGMDKLITNQVCDPECDSPSCGFDQGVCKKLTSLLSCTEWCRSSGLGLFKSLDSNRDGFIKGNSEMELLKSLYYKAELEDANAFVTLGLVAYYCVDAGVAPSGSNCWGCDIIGMYANG